MEQHEKPKVKSLRNGARENVGNYEDAFKASLKAEVERINSLIGLIQESVIRTRHMLTNRSFTGFQIIILISDQDVSGILDHFRQSQACIMSEFDILSSGSNGLHFYGARLLASPSAERGNFLVTVQHPALIFHA